MISVSQSIKYNLEENGSYLGELTISKFIKKISLYKIPFVKVRKQKIIKIGNGNYKNFDDFIIFSLNDYYAKLNNINDLKKKEEMLNDYKVLYTLWSNICLKKEENNLLELNSLYNKISYKLYLLGYSDNQL